MKTRIIRWLAPLGPGLLGLLLVAGCATVPETGRRQVMLVSGAQATQLGLSSFEQMKKEQPISKNAAANALVQKVGQRIAAVAPLPNAQWEFVVFESKEANAFCLPGGKVGVYTGILPITRDEAGLAAVIGHGGARGGATWARTHEPGNFAADRGELLAAGCRAAIRERRRWCRWPMASAPRWVRFCLSRLRI